MAMCDDASVPWRRRAPIHVLFFGFSFYVQ